MNNQEFLKGMAEKLAVAFGNGIDAPLISFGSGTIPDAAQRQKTQDEFIATIKQLAPKILGAAGISAGLAVGGRKYGPAISRSLSKLPIKSWQNLLNSISEKAAKPGVPLAELLKIKPRMSGVMPNYHMSNVDPTNHEYTKAIIKAGPVEALKKKYFDYAIKEDPTEKGKMLAHLSLDLKGQLAQHEKYQRLESWLQRMRVTRAKPRHMLPSKDNKLDFALWPTDQLRTLLSQVRRPNPYKSELRELPLSLLAKRNKRVYTESENDANILRADRGRAYHPDVDSPGVTEDLMSLVRESLNNLKQL